jgi:hypothetical protein
MIYAIEISLTYKEEEVHCKCITFSLHFLTVPELRLLRRKMIQYADCT